MRALFSRAVVVVLAASLLTLGALRNAWPYFVDDAFISLRYAERLSSGSGLTWTDGERVEGYSNLLWVLLTAGLGGLGLDLVDAARLLGFVCTLGALAIGTSRFLTTESAPARLAIVVVSAQACTAVWAIAGLEVPLTMLLVTIAVWGLSRGVAATDERSALPFFAAAGVALAFANWTRPDAPIWSVAAAAAVVSCARHGARTKALSLVLAPAIAAVLMQTGFRLWYYGDWVPNTAHAKATPSAASRAVGIDYLTSAAAALRSLFVPAVLGLLIGWRLRVQRPALVFAVVGTVCWCAYLVQVGGDTFPRSRLLVPALVPLGVLAAAGIASLSSWGRAGKAAAWAVAIAAIALGRVDAEAPQTDTRQVLTTWEWEGAATGRWLGRTFADRKPLLAVDAAGAVPYFSGLPCLDMLGLCDRVIARTPAPPDLAFIPGHNRGNGSYVLDREPDAVMFWLPPGNPQPRWLSGAEMEDDPRFLADYRVALFDTDVLRLDDGTEKALRITLWLRVGGRLGVRTEQNHVTLPGHLLDSFHQPRPLRLFTKARQPTDSDFAETMAEAQRGGHWWQKATVVGSFDESSRSIVTKVRGAGRFEFPRIPLPAGRWTADFDEHEARMNVQLVDANGAALPRVGNAWRVDAVADGAREVVVACTVAPDAPLPIVFRDLHLRRAD